MSPEESTKHLIVIGSSAGGVEALSVLVSTLPKPFPAPILIAQHLDPKRVSHLVEILTRRSTLPVKTIEDGETLAPGTVYVVPSNRHVEVIDHRATYAQECDKRPLPSVDLVLKSAAKSYGENLIAAILTGAGTDGATGARDVKLAGGTVIIQNPDSASFPSMPESLAPNTVDIVTSIDRLGPLLRDLVTGEYEKISEDPLKSLLEKVHARSGIDFSHYKTATIQRRLRRRIIATDSRDVETYSKYLETHPDEYQKLINSFLIKVTEFMRDPDLFQYLRTTILPQVIAGAREEKSDIRVWSAGCATGEEAYSLAIELSELLGDNIDKTTVRIFATDLDAEAIAFARRGIYPASSVAELPPEIVNKYFMRSGESFQVRKRLRNLTVFGEHDLGQRAPFPNIRLVMCRNVMIYFTAELQRRTLQMFAFSLQHGGFLVLGKAETTSPKGEYFASYKPEFKIFQRQGEKVLLPPSRISTSTLPSRISGRKAGELETAEAARARRDMQVMKDSVESILRVLPLGVVLVNKRYDILEINPAARKLLGISSPAIGEDFIHLAQCVPHRELRNAIDDAFRQETPKALENVKIETVANEKPLHVKIDCFPQLSDAGKVDSVLVLAADVSTDTEQKKALEQSRAAAEKGKKHAETMMQRLAQVNRELIASNEDLTANIAQLRTSNEELLLNSEEAQAAAEEVETLNEEMQSSNEELETVNEELQSTIEELNTTNADLEARSRELQDLAKMQERFVAMSSHELRTPLVPLQGSLELLQNMLSEKTPDPARARQLIASALAQIKRITTLVNDLMDATRMQSGKFQLRHERIDMKALAARTVQVAQAFTRKHSIELVEAADGVYVDGDPIRLEQVVFNLLSNAINHANESKRIDVRLSRTENEAVLEVQDYGAGISKDDLGKLFSAFYQTQQSEQTVREGLGLGLFICKEIVTAHHGKIEAQSEIGKGTTFKVVLPLHPKEK